MNQYHFNPAMEALVRSAVLAEQMSKKRTAIEHRAEQGTARKVPRTAENIHASSQVASAPNTKPVTKEAPGKRAGKKKHKEQFNYPVEPRIIVMVKKPRTIMNHSYRDFSQVPAELDYEKPTKLEDMSLSEKVHDILSIKAYAPFIAWMAHGRAFRIQIPKMFEEQICPKYFGHSRYSSFLRLLNNHGFKHISQGSDRNCYYHESFLRGMPHLCKYMPNAKNARHLVPDPENEPNFYSLSKSFPLADQEEDIVIPLASEKRTPALPRDVPSRPGAARTAPPAVRKHKRNVQPPAEVVPIVRAAHTEGAALLVAAAAVQQQPDLSALLRQQRLLGNRQAAFTGEQQAAIDNNAILNAALRSRFSQNQRGWGGYPF